VPFPAGTLSAFSEARSNLILTDGSLYPQKGKILLADRQVDPNTGTIRIVAAFPNPATFCVPASMDECVSKPT